MSQNFQESRLVNDSNLTDYVIRDVLSVFETYGLGPPGYIRDLPRYSGRRCGWL